MSGYDADVLSRTKYMELSFTRKKPGVLQELVRIEAIFRLPCHHLPHEIQELSFVLSFQHFF